MAYRNSPKIRKEERAELATLHTQEMGDKYKKDITIAVKHTTVYDIDFQFTKDAIRKDTKVIVEALDTVSAINKYYTKDSVIALLNFASYKNPGGGFLEGSMAQEECLCHESFLYNVLKEFRDSFYNWNNQHKNRALYHNRALYSEDIVFEHNGNISYSDVVSCASPNKMAAQKYQKISDKENTKVLRSRIKFVLNIARENNVDILVLGAYGCGVFGQNPKEVASIFKEYLSTTHKCFDKVIFAIPKGRDGNYSVFKSVFDDKR